MIHICYGLYDRDGRYSKLIGTSMASIFENTAEDVTVHILHDNTLTVGNRDKFIYLTGKYGQSIEFYNVETLASERVEQFRENLPTVLKSDYSIATLYRLLMPELIPSSVARLIYLDADILVNRDINDLWKIGLGGAPIAAVPEILLDLGFHKNKLSKYLLTSGLVREEDYFNAGVLLIDLQYLRDNADILLDGYKFVCEHPQCNFFDQDILNYCFASRSVKLPETFDLFTLSERLRKEPRGVMRAMYHYVGNAIRLDLKDQFNRLYMGYYAKTPWFDFEVPGRIFAFVDGMNKANQTSTLKMIKLIGKKQRAFCMDAKNVAALRALFEIGDDETVLEAGEDDIEERLIELLTPRKTVCFIFSGKYQRCKEALLDRDFVEGVDFVNALSLVSSLIGIPTESHPIFKSM